MEVALEEAKKDDSEDAKALEEIIAELEAIFEEKKEEAPVEPEVPEEVVEPDVPVEPEVGEEVVEENKEEE